MKRISFNKDWNYRGKKITLPHDAMLGAERHAGAQTGSGGAFFEGGVYEYDKSFFVPYEWKDKDMLLQFEGVYRNARVYINGTEAGFNAYGYIPFFIKLNSLSYGEENHIKVVADNSMVPNSRWYSGGGIYRSVWLWECEKGGLKPECVKISTVSYSPAKVLVEADCESEPEITILDDGTELIKTSGNRAEIEIPDAVLWSAEEPKLYTCRVSLNGDETEVNFGIRLVEWSTNGLYINGEEILLRGGCIHHDNGILGSADNAESDYRRVRILKENGFNAIRSAHNPISPSMLSACDELGMYIMDETWDMWYRKKNPEDYAADFPDNYISDIKALVNRDFCHPSVIMYSIGNEVTEPYEEAGVNLAKEMTELFHELDPSRAVTAGINLMIITTAANGNPLYKDGGGKDNKSEQKASGMNSTMFNAITSVAGTKMVNAANSKRADLVTTPVLDALDIAGYNYATGRYVMDGKLHPDRIIVGSETFPQQIAENWALVKKLPYLIGDFMWTAWDYLGENGIGAWGYSDDANTFDKPYPWLLADTGALDILGNPNGEAFWAQAVWGLLDEPKIAVQPVNRPGKKLSKAVWRGTNAIPSWSFTGCEGNTAVVEVYFDCARVDLLLNGIPIGGAKVKDCRAVIKTKYAPGKLEAICYNARGNEIARGALITSNGADITVKPEKRCVRPGEVLYAAVEIGDGSSVESNADRLLTVNVKGGELLGFGSANPRTEESFLSGEYTTYYGHALIAARAGEKSESLILSVSDGSETVETSVEIK